MSEVFEVAEYEGDVTAYGNVVQRRIQFHGRQKLPAHEHNYPHAHIVVKGTIRCTLFDGAKMVSVTDYPAPAIFEVPANFGHQLESVTDGAEGWCIFAIRDEDGVVVYNPTQAQKKDRFNSERKGAGV